MEKAQDYGQCLSGEAEADPDHDPVAGLDAFTRLMKARERPLSDQQALPDADAGRLNEILLRHADLRAAGAWQDRSQFSGIEPPDA